jgi:hypothetical protein
MNPTEFDRFIEALEGIAFNLSLIYDRGLKIDLPDGVEIASLPDEVFIRILNPIIKATGKAEPFITKSL